TPLEITSAFATFANNGVHIEPSGIIRVEDRNGLLIKDFQPEMKDAISPQTAYLMTELMSSVVDEGTAQGVRKYFHLPAAGKTGTTQDFADAWFVGYTPQLCAGVWVGFDDQRVKFTGWYGQGARAAAPIWAKFMAKAYADPNTGLTLEYFEQPDGITTATFCRTSLQQGIPKLASDYCPAKVTDIVNSKFIPEICDIHTVDRGYVPIQIDTVGNRIDW
ncbi:MAG: penicillin-binding transpeptidase domain-containing protein, partial [Ignavibacteria bacterium]|nr:penicillin-binding transpeptidase domain-containing protein [Ignavibacteria bacterium]